MGQYLTTQHKEPEDTLTIWASPNALEEWNVGFLVKCNLADLMKDGFFFGTKTTMKSIRATC